jgi:hypothetical protein
MSVDMVFALVYLAFGFLLCFHISERYVQSAETIWALLATTLAMVMAQWLKVFFFGCCICINEFAEDTGETKMGVPINAPVPRDGIFYTSMQLAAVGSLWFYMDRQVSAPGGSQVGLTPQFLDYCWLFLSILAVHVTKYTAELLNMVDAWAWTATKGDPSDFTKICVPLMDGDAAHYSYTGHWKLVIVANRFFSSLLSYNSFAMCILLAIQQYSGGEHIWAPKTWIDCGWLLTTWIIYACLTGLLLIAVFTAHDKPCIFGHLVQGFGFYASYFLFTIFVWNEVRLFISDGTDQTYTTVAASGQKYRNIRWGMLLTHFLYFFHIKFWSIRCFLNSEVRKTFFKNFLTM